jgi:hypothetical protein
LKITIEKLHWKGVPIVSVPESNRLDSDGNELSLTNLMSNGCVSDQIQSVLSSNRTVEKRKMENERCRRCDGPGIPGKLGFCAMHFDEYERTKQEIIQDDYNS